MKITCLTTFLDGRDRFEKGDVRTVDDERGAYFVGHGWAAEMGSDVVAAEHAGDVSLDVNNSALGQEANHG